VTYTAPASKVFTVAHIVDPDVPASEKPEPSDGATRCALPLVVADLWVDVDPLATDLICRGCQGLTDEQGSMW
jgi:hypothetical protein